MVPDDLLASVAAGADGRRGGVRVPAGEWLFHEGDEPDGAYLVESGRLEIVDESAGGERLRVVGAGRVIGELSLLSGEARSAGVRAIRDAVLTWLPSAEFERLVEERPGFGLALARSLAQALRETRAPARVHAPKPPATIAVLGENADAYADRLAATLGAPIFLPDGDWGAALDAAETEHAQIVLPTQVPGTWRDFCVRQADRVLVLASGSAPPDGAPRGCDLVLEAGAPAHDCIRQLAPRRTYLRTDLERIARRLSGRAVGVVLSGGGARGLAHVGVLAELERAGVVVDRVGGCSMGALVGALYAQGRVPTDIAHALRAELVRRRPFGDYTVPRTSLIRAERAATMLEHLLGDARIEHFERDYFCVSADLLTADEVVHRHGLARDAVLASMSLPGVMPPRRDGGRLLVDGGVLDNLPVRPMADDGAGPVIAVDAMGRRLTDEDERAPHAPPGILEILARATVLGSWGRLKAQAELATVTIRPVVAGIGLTDFGRLDAALDAGRRAAAGALADGGLAAIVNDIEEAGDPR